MSDLIRRLRDPARGGGSDSYEAAAELEQVWEMYHGLQEEVKQQDVEIERLLSERRAAEDGEAAALTEVEQLRAEVERLTTENWQLKQALGYPIPADKDTPNNPFRCGVCDARSDAKNLKAAEGEKETLTAADAIARAKGWFDGREK